MYKKEINLFSTAIANYFNVPTRTQHNYNLRRRESNISHFSSNTATGRKSIQNEGEIFWNELPPYLKNVDSPLTFKKLLKSHLIGPPET